MTVPALVGAVRRFLEAWDDDLEDLSGPQHIESAVSNMRAALKQHDRAKRRADETAKHLQRYTDRRARLDD